MNIFALLIAFSLVYFIEICEPAMYCESSRTLPDSSAVAFDAFVNAIQVHGSIFPNVRLELLIICLFYGLKIF
jgi:hypothetical protein